MAPVGESPSLHRGARRSAAARDAVFSPVVVRVVGSEGSPCGSCVWGTRKHVAWWLRAGLWGQTWTSPLLGVTLTSPHLGFLTREVLEIPPPVMDRYKIK